MPTNWKYIKKLLEKEFLCEKLRGHITYDLTDYRPAPWYQQHFIMKFDDEVLLDASQPDCKWDKRYHYPKIIPYEIHQISEKLCREKNFARFGVPDYVWQYHAAHTTEAVLANMAHYEGIYGVQELIKAIGEFLHSDIQTSLYSEEYFIRALAILDRRCGKRTLEKLAKEKWLHIPDWLKRIYLLRFETEGIRYS